MSIQDKLLDIFVRELDRRVQYKIQLVAFGGSALTLLSLKQRTIDVDIHCGADRKYLKPILLEIKKQVGFKIDAVYDRDFFGAIIPDLQDRIIGPIKDIPLQYVSLYALHPVDTILCKLGRYDGRDIWDIEYALKHSNFSEKEFDERFNYFLQYYQKSKRIFQKNYDNFKVRFKEYLK